MVKTEASRGAPGFEPDGLIPMHLIPENGPTPQELIQVVVFDLDGLLIDNKKFRTHFIAVAHRLFGVRRKVAFDHYMENPDFTSSEQIESFIEKFGEGLGLDQESTSVRDAKKELFDRVSKQKGDPMPFAVETLEWLKDHGIRAVICTGEEEADARNKIFGTPLGKYFSPRTIIGCDSTPDGKTTLMEGEKISKGEPQLSIVAKRLGFPTKTEEERQAFKDAVLYATDTPVDMLLAKMCDGVTTYLVSDNAQTRTWGIKLGSHQTEETLKNLTWYVYIRNFRAEVRSITQRVAVHK